ncbi:phosphoethanolamine transferase [Jeongeupia sp. USM3]|uniref:phosphoethanolamine transferase n=1 Tax=Jeongeupia sp. USM3 TaxID=1906741 RepID=UPI001F1983AC|nr:phosphoethanolamine transferase [Jeongeupia sp. USM3]
MTAFRYAGIAVAGMFVAVNVATYCLSDISYSEFPLWTISLFVLLFVISVIGQWKYIAWVLAPAALLAPFEAFYLWYYRRPSSSHLYGILAESNFAEIVEFLSPWGSLFCLSVFTCGAFGVIWLCQWAGTWRVARKRLRLALFLLSASALVGVTLAHEITMLPQELGLSSDALSDKMSNDVFVDVKKTYFPGIYLRLWGYVDERRNMQLVMHEKAGFKFNARYVGSEKQIVVLIIGESSRKDRWSLYGYQRETNPELAKIKNLVVLRDMVTPWDSTRMSVPVMISRKPALSSSMVFPEKSVVSLFGEAGFHTYWISNQQTYGRYDSPITQFAGEANERFYLNPAEYSGPGSMDGVLVKKLEEILARKQQRVFVVLHMLGSHWNYKHRYPSEYDVFRPSLNDVGDVALQSASSRQEVSNSFDNTILYTDRVLSDVAKLLSAQKNPAFFWYASDHGEDLQQTDCALRGHGNSTRGSLEVPSIIYYNQAFYDISVGDVNLLQSNASKKISTQSVFYGLSWLAGVRAASLSSDKALSEMGFKEEKRMVNGKRAVSYDEAVSNLQCQPL